MTALTDALTALRGLVAEAAGGADVDLRPALDSSKFAQADVTTVPGKDSIDHVRVKLSSPVRVEELEQLWGPARPLPRRPSGGSTRTMTFDSTLPGEGESGATVLAEADSKGCVESLIVRADSF